MVPWLLDASNVSLFVRQHTLLTNNEASSSAIGSPVSALAEPNWRASGRAAGEKGARLVVPPEGVRVHGVRFRPYG